MFFPGDCHWVRIEIVEALSRKKLVIPILVEGARMSGAKDLPTEITLLAERNAIEVSAARFEHHMERLVQRIAGKPQATATASRWSWISDPNHQRTLGFIGAFIAALVAGGWQLYVHFSAASKPASPTSVSVGDGGIAGNVNTTAEAGGVAVTNTGDTAAAEALFGKALEQGKVQAAKAAEAAYQLGQLAYEHIDYKKAYAYYQEAAKLEPDNPRYLNMAGKLAREVGASLNNLALLNDAQGHYGKAEPLHQRALAIRERALGPEHPDVALSLNNLGALYFAQGQYGKAEPLHQRALQILQTALPSDHPTLVQLMENYSSLLAKLNRDPEAKEWRFKADAARRQHADTNRDAP